MSAADELYKLDEEIEVVPRLYSLMPIKDKNSRWLVSITIPRIRKLIDLAFLNACSIITVSILLWIPFIVYRN